MSNVNPIVENKGTVVKLDARTTEYSYAVTAYRVGNVVQVCVRFINVPIGTLVTIATNLPRAILYDEVYGVYGSGTHDNGAALNGFVRAIGDGIQLIILTGSPSGNGHATVTYITEE